jgi:Holliday junction resolvase RusA-like endonuclease
VFRLELWVPGKPAPGGSKRAFVNKHTGRVAVVDDAKNNSSWRATVRDFAAREWGDRDLIQGPIRAEVIFREMRAASHYGARGRIKPSAPPLPQKKPDATKLWRAAEDALTGVLWRDDVQVADQRVRKVYGPKPGMLVRLYELVRVEDTQQGG